MLTVWLESKISRNIRFTQQADDTWNLMASEISHGSTSSPEHRINANLTYEILHQFFWCLWRTVSFESWASEQHGSGRKETSGKTETETPCQTKDPCNLFSENICQKTPLEQLRNRKISRWCICWKICISQRKFKLLSQKQYFHICRFLFHYFFQSLFSSDKFLMLKTTFWQGTPQQTTHYMMNRLLCLGLTNHLLDLMTLTLFQQKRWCKVFYSPSHHEYTDLCHVSPLTSPLQKVPAIWEIYLHGNNSIPLIARSLTLTNTVLLLKLIYQFYIQYSWCRWRI